MKFLVCTLHHWSAKQILQITPLQFISLTKTLLILFLDAPLRKASQVQINQRAHMKVRGGLANIGLAPQPLLGEAGNQGRSGSLINIQNLQKCHCFDGTLMGSDNQVQRLYSVLWVLTSGSNENNSSLKVDLGNHWGFFLVL